MSFLKGVGFWITALTTHSIALNFSATMYCPASVFVLVWKKGASSVGHVVTFKSIYVVEFSPFASHSLINAIICFSY